MSDVIGIPGLVANAAFGSGVHDLEEIQRAIYLIIGEELHALRAIQLNGPDDKSVFDTGPTSAQEGFAEVKQLLDRCRLAQVFIQLNPTGSADAAGAGNTWSGHLGTDCPQRFTRRKWLLVDVDPVRAPETNSTDLELSLAATVAQRVLEYLSAAGAKEPIVGLSGNGIHLLYHIDLPADGVATDLVRNCLRTLAARFRTETVAIDRKVFDCPRLTRVYGTVNRKGPSTADRPQRSSQLLFVPQVVEITPRTVWEQVAREAPNSVSSHVGSVAENLKRASQLLIYPKISIDDFLTLLHNVSSSGLGWVACCPAHADGTPSLSITVTPDGTILLHCHAGCEFEQIVKSLGLRPSQLFGSGHSARTPIASSERCEHPTNSGLTAYAEYCRSCLTYGSVAYLAQQLGVTIDSLLQLGLGWSAEHNAWTIPERRSDGGVIGIQRRFANGKKRMIDGGHRGLILPANWWRWTGNVLIPEGASDVAAALSRGLQAIGRPSAACAPGLAKLLANTPAIVPIVFGENDQKDDGSWPGMDGANRVARELATALGREISVAFPPVPYKDIRDFFSQLKD